MNILRKFNPSYIELQDKFVNLLDFPHLNVLIVVYLDGYF
jgi:hypothetical protein